MGRLYLILVIIVFAAIMAAVTFLIKKFKGMSADEDLVKSPPKKRNKKNAFEEYCNGNKNASRRQLANYILIHEDAERKKRGQR